MASNSADDEIDLSKSSSSSSNSTPQKSEQQKRQQRRLEASYPSQSSFRSYDPMAANASGVQTSGGGAFPLGIMSPLSLSAMEGFRGAASTISILQPSVYGAASCDTASITLGIEDRKAAASISLLRGGDSLDATDQRRMTQQQHPLPMASPPPAMTFHQYMTHGSELNHAAFQLEQEAAKSGSGKGKEYLSPMLRYGSHPSARASVKLSSQSESTTLKEFPFIFDGYSGWVCRHCSHLDHYYRGPNYYIQGDRPPPNDFVDEHLRFCPTLNRSWSYGLGSITGQGGQYRQTPIQYPREEEEIAEYAAAEEGKKPSRERQDAQTELSSTRGRKRAAGEEVSAKGCDITIETYTKALSLLQKRADKLSRLSSVDDVRTTVVQEEDLTLLTDYFYYIALQLTVCRFNEEDRSVRGGKRKNIQILFGGLQCTHCASTPSARKFFWSSVDRLANSFAEIPAHVMKCKDCPVEVKDALLVLKSRHVAQMALLPRGSQKVFLRRMWRRLHDGDADEARTAAKPVHSGLLERDSALKAPPESGSALISPKKRAPVLLAMPQDEDWLSDLDCFVRKQVEIFSASKTDVKHAEEDQKYPISVGQVGLRCLHCAKLRGKARDDTVLVYPCSISGIYESVRELQRCHLSECSNLPPELKRERSKLIGGASSLSSVLRRYYVQAARALGLYDSEDGGIRAGGTVAPLTEAGLSESDLAGKQDTHLSKNSEGRYDEEEKPAKKTRR